MQLHNPIRRGTLPSSFHFRPAETPTLLSGIFRIDCRLLSTSLSLSKIVRGGRRNGWYEGIRKRKSGWPYAPVHPSGAAGYRTVDL